MCYISQYIYIYVCGVRECVCVHACVRAYVCVRACVHACVAALYVSKMQLGACGMHACIVHVDQAWGS